jgi:cyclic-di-GMP phosphodiesterase TipF (flagellum assembly factor)
MEHADGQASDIAAGDLSALLARASVVLIADQVEDDPTVADMIELGVLMGQGLVFSPPRPVKPDVFAEPAPAAVAPAPEPLPPPQAAEIIGYPAPPPVQDAPRERQSFRSVLRRASA